MVCWSISKESHLPKIDTKTDNVSLRYDFQKVFFSIQETCFLSYENTILPYLKILVTGMGHYFQNKYLNTFSQNLLLTLLRIQKINV